MATIVVAAAQQKFREALCGVLTAYRHQTVTVATAEQVTRLIDDRTPELVLFDLTLLGIETLAKLRARAPHVPVIALAEQISPETESRVRELGALDVLRTGLKLDVLMHVISRALQKVAGPTRWSAAAPVHPDESDGPTAKAATILLVDDEQEIIDLVGEFLARRGYRIRTASNGEDALAMIQRDPPDLVLLDVYMPQMNGVDVLRRLRAPMASASPSVGIILLTASQDEPLLQEALDLGAFDVLSKPVDLNQVELAVMVKLLLNTHP